MLIIPQIKPYIMFMSSLVTGKDVMWRFSESKSERKKTSNFPKGNMNFKKLRHTNTSLVIRTMGRDSRKILV